MLKIDKVRSLLEEIIENYSSQCVALRDMMYRLFEVGTRSVENKWLKDKIAHEIRMLILKQEFSLGKEQKNFVNDCVVAILECQEDKGGENL